MIAKKNKVFYALLGVLLISLGRASWLWYLAPVSAVCGYALLWLSVSSLPKKRFLALWALFSSVNLIHLTWLLSHPFLYIIAVWIALSFLFALPYALISLRIISTPLSFARTIGYAALLCLVEWGFTCLPCGFSFQTAALHLSWSPFSLQLSSICGAIGLSFFVFLTNLSFYSWIHHSSPGAYTLFLVLFPYFVGGGIHIYKTAEQSSFDRSTPKLQIALYHTEELPDVLSHLSPYELHEYKWQQIFHHTAHMKGSGKLDLIVFPEAVVPYPAESQLFQSSKLPHDFSYKKGEALLSSLELAHLIAHFHNAPILIGLESQHMEGSTNSCFFVSPTCPHIKRYDKQLLLPFGEYIPFAPLQSFLKAYGVYGSFFPGKETKLFDTYNLRVAPLICYEETFPLYTEKAALLNPTCLVSLNNDGWFPDSRLKIEHFEQARLRAVESGKPFIRSCNKGRSGVIDALGQSLYTEKEGCWITRLSSYSSFSPFLFVGTTNVALFFLFVFFLSFSVAPSVNTPNTK